MSTREANDLLLEVRVATAKAQQAQTLVRMADAGRELLGAWLKLDEFLSRGGASPDAWARVVG